MPRKRRFLPVGQPCHAVNRGQDRRTLFFQDADYQHFMDLMAEGRRRYPIRIYGYSLIPNHFHKILCPLEKGAVSAYMQWVEGRYGCHFRWVTNTCGHGHVYQGRFWAEPVGTGPFKVDRVVPRERMERQRNRRVALPPCGTHGRRLLQRNAAFRCARGRDTDRPANPR